MPKISLKFWKKWFFFDFSKWLLIMIWHHRSASKHPPDFRELFSSYIEAPNNFFEKVFDFKTACDKLFFTKRLVKALKMSFYGAHYRNRNINTRSSGESISFGGWRTWPYATFYVSFLRKNNFSWKFWKKSFWYGPAHPYRK